MAGVFGYSREAVRVKVKKCENGQPPEFRKFSVDPQITSFEVLQSILLKAFDLKTDFTISYRIYDVNEHETYLPLLSDWDLDAAFLKAYNNSVTTSTEPCLCLLVDPKTIDESVDDWELRQNLPIITQMRQEIKPSPRLHGIFNQMGKTLNMVQKAFNFGEDGTNSAVTQQLLQPPRPPLSDAEFRTFLDPVGQILYSKELRSVIYFGGIEPSLRKVVWKHLLNVYPDGMTGRERMDYIKRKAGEYLELKETWKNAINQGLVVGELAYTTGMVRKDVLRTDRHHPFYAGSDDNQNIASLFNILTTYALNHPKVSYCQGMSDLASPLLVTMNDEAHAYICFCALMQRLSTNFMIDGIAMTQKFAHLAEGLMYYDPEFYNYLKSYQADDLLFCYRWLLLEMKREFAFDDSLRMLEVLWSSLPADPPTNELKLYDIKFQPQQIQQTPPISPLVKQQQQHHHQQQQRETVYTKICELRRQSSSISISNFTKPTIVKRQNHSLDESFIKTKIIVDIKQKYRSLDDGVLSQQHLQQAKRKMKTDCSNRSRSVSPLEPKSDSIVFNNQINNKIVDRTKSCSLTSIKMNHRKNEHFKDLKERLSHTKLFTSLEKLDINSTLPPSGGKIVRNLNEFLNFVGPNQTKSQDDNGDKPKILLTKSSFDQDSNKTAINNNDDNNSNSSSNSNNNSPDSDYCPLTTSVTRELRLELENLDRKVFGDKFVERLTESAPTTGDVKVEKTRNSMTIERDVFIWENPLHQTINVGNISTGTPDEQVDLEMDDVDRKIDDDFDMMNSCEEVTEVTTTTTNVTTIHTKSSTILPPPNEFGGGNPFLMFLCLTVLLQHRDYIISKNMDYNEMAMHFDKMVRKHNVIKVLNQARKMYARYMKQHTIMAQDPKSSTEDC